MLRLLRPSWCFIIALLGTADAAGPFADAAGPFGLAQKPPRGWRSWNAFGTDVTQAKMQGAMIAMADRSRTFVDRDGKSKVASLADLGFVHAGLDDSWQACGAGIEGSFHDAEGNPLV